MAEKKFDSKWLDGLKYSDAEIREVVKDGRKLTQGVPRTVAAKEEHVLAWDDKGASVVIVMKDGKKYTINKKPDKKE